MPNRIRRLLVRVEVDVEDDAGLLLDRPLSDNIVLPEAQFDMTIRDWLAKNGYQKKENGDG